MTLIELSACLSMLAGLITGAAVGGARHGVLEIILGAVGGIVIGFASFVAAASPIGLISRKEPQGLRAKFDNAVAGFGLTVLIPFAPVGAGIVTWWVARMIAG